MLLVVFVVLSLIYAIFLHSFCNTVTSLHFLFFTLTADSVTNPNNGSRAWSKRRRRLLPYILCSEGDGLVGGGLVRPVPPQHISGVERVHADVLRTPRSPNPARHPCIYIWIVFLCGLVCIYSGYQNLRSACQNNYRTLHLLYKHYTANRDQKWKKITY